MYEMKQGFQKKEKYDFENIKSAQAIAKQNLEVEQMLTLSVGKQHNNIAQ